MKTNGEQQYTFRHTGEYKMTQVRGVRCELVWIPALRDRTQDRASSNAKTMLGDGRFRETVRLTQQAAWNRLKEIKEFPFVLTPSKHKYLVQALNISCSTS